MDFKLLEQLGGLGGLMDKGLALVTCLLVILAIGVGVYVLRTVMGMLRPVVAIVFWLFGVRPGERPGDLAAGVAMGLRLLVWVGIVGASFWVGGWQMGWWDWIAASPQ
jgi:hypothetical protein